LQLALRAAFGRPCQVTASGRDALARILTYLRLQASDEVWIDTTTCARYLAISPCVTATVSKFCRFAHGPGSRTAAVLVIHDWGVPNPRLPSLKDYCRARGLPLIEDAAHAFASVDAVGRRMGTVGDFALFSLPKFFPIRQGGLAIGLSSRESSSEPAVQEAERALAGWLPRWQEIAAARRERWHTLDAAVREVGLESALRLPRGVAPSLYLLRTPRQFATITGLRQAGIETGPDQYTGTVFLPCHQQVRSEDMARIVAAVSEAAGS